MSINRFVEALDFCDLAIEKNPENAEYYNGKGII